MLNSHQQNSYKGDEQASIQHHIECTLGKSDLERMDNRQYVDMIL